MSYAQDSYTTTSGVTAYATTFGVTSKELLVVQLAGTILTEDTDYTVTGYGDASQSVTVTLDADLSYTVGDVLLLTRIIKIDASNPDSSMLTTFSNNSTVTNQQLQNEFSQVYQTLGKIIGSTGNILASADITTLNTAVSGTGSAGLAGATANIITLQTQVAAATADISTNTTNIASNTANITSNDADILDLQTRAMLQSAQGAAFSAESQKITLLAPGTITTDACTYGQMIAAAVTGVYIPGQTGYAGFALITDGASPGALSWGTLGGSAVSDAMAQAVYGITADSGLATEGTITFAKTLSDANELMNWQQSYRLYSDNVDLDGGAGTRLIIDCPDNGEVQIGPRVGANILDEVRFRSEKIGLKTTAGSTDITVPSGGNLAVGGNTVLAGDNSVKYQHLDLSTGATAAGNVAAGDTVKVDIGLGIAGYMPIACYVKSTTTASEIEHIIVGWCVDGTDIKINVYNNHTSTVNGVEIGWYTLTV